jgi:hypothetical protein
MIPVDDSPLAFPLTYPGIPPQAPFTLITPGAVIPVPDAGALPLYGRCPVLAVGSNACAAQLRRKFRGTAHAIPLTRVLVTGLISGHCAHVGRTGIVPATPVLVPGAACTLHITWLTPTEVVLMDATEPGYDRVPVPAACPVLLDGQPVTGCQAYASQSGALAAKDGMPLALMPQPALMALLRDAVPGLHELTGSTPQGWLRAMADPAARDAARILLAGAGLRTPTGMEAGG